MEVLTKFAIYGVNPVLNDNQEMFGLLYFYLFCEATKSLFEKVTEILFSRS